MRMDLGYLRTIHLRNGSKNPKVPIEKLSTGGTAPALNRDDAWRIVPSPPSVTTKSIFSGLAEEERLTVV